MFEKNIKTASWIALGCALALWCAAGYLLLRVDGAQSAYVAEVQQSQNSSGQLQNAAIAHLAVERTSAQATQLSSALAVDPVAFATLLQSVGQASGASVQISGAVPETVPGAPSSSGGPQIYAFGFSVQVDGSFTADMRALQLLQTLPAPSSVQEVDLAESAPSGKAAASWQMAVQVRLVTTDNISS